MVNRRTAFLKTLFAVIVWGASFIATKVVIQELAPIAVVWMRFAMGVVILGAAVMLRGQWQLPAKQDLPLFLLLGFLGIALHQWLQSNGLLTAQASTTAWIVATMPAFIALLGWAALKEPMGPVRWMGILLAAVGGLLVITRGDLASLRLGQLGSPGDFLILLSAPNWAVFSVLSRPSLQKHPPARMMFYVMLLGWLLVSVLCFAGPGVEGVLSLTAQGWIALAFLGVFCSGLAYIFWYDALGSLPASQVGVFLYIEPLVGVLAAATILEELLTWTSAAGGATILLGVWLVNRPRT
jgi:drug/metabolite transporter (DMT)-like permease